ncbi:MAG: alginate export family protein [Armatimonadetes bacterium]|nr:alginate export family protein [Armatimonadota bacterium]
MRRLMVVMFALGVISNVMAQPSSLTTSVTWRVRAESWNFFDPGVAGIDESYIFAASLLRAGVSGKAGKSQDWKLELSQVAFSDLPENSIAPAPAGDLGFGAIYYRWNRKRDGSIFLKQAYWQWRGKMTTFRLGRFEFGEGTERMPKDPTLSWLRRNRVQERLLGSFGFSHVQRSFDGLLFSQDSKDGNFSLALLRPTRGVFDLKGNDQLSEVTTLYASWTSSIDPQNDWRLFALHYRDKRDVVKTSNTANITGDVKVTTLGGHYLRTWQSGEGKFDTVVWGAWQLGDWGQLDHKALAYAVELGYQWTKEKWQPWLRIGYFFGSGDGNPNDDEHETFFQVLSTPRLYARAPLYNMMNNRDLFVQLMLKPAKNLSLRLDWHRLWLAKSQDLWYTGGGAFNNTAFGYVGRPSGGSKRLMDVLDLSIDYTPDQNTTWTLYLAKLMGKDVVKANFPADSDGFFAYLEFVRRW